MARTIKHGDTWFIDDENYDYSTEIQKAVDEGDYQKAAYLEKSRNAKIEFTTVIQDESSKATPAGAIAKFAASGKRVRKKDLGMMAMSYGYVYVAQVAMGASPAQYFNAIKEAEAYDGPSLVIAYAPCINHGLKAGMGLSQKEEKLAVECGYWHLYRYNPALEGTDKNPFTLDSKEPDWSKFQDFLKGEVRFASLYKMYPDCAEELLQKTEEFAKVRLETYKRLAK
jgi:pyruvate-ferredoxin/flavodoxin oxidoreductase